MSFRKVAAREDLWSGEMARVDVNGENILLVNLDDRFYAFADACPHQNSRLSEGNLMDNTLRCARHHWEFDVCTGRGINPQNACLKMFPVKIDGEDILVDLNVDYPLRARAGGGNEK
jgi:toluene monooxygenase system ferredoxin subunit